MNDINAQVRTYGHKLLDIAREHSILTSLIFIHFFAAFISTIVMETPYEPELLRLLSGLFTTMIPVFLIVLTCWSLVRMAVVDKPESPLRAFTSHIRQTFTDIPALLRGVFSLVLISIFFRSFTYFKVAIPEFKPFSWDPFLAELDRILHFGYHPYELVMKVLGTPFMTTLINAVYHGWLFVMYFVLFVACFTKYRPSARMTFLAAFVLTWAIGGNLFAILLSSAGPVYYQPLGYGNDFSPLVAKLHEFSYLSPVWSLDVHALLWEGYTTEAPSRGISAMPSMHLASSALLALYGFTYARWAGWLLTVFTGLILIGSVHLAWHYAIDGYAGILIAIVCWKLAAGLVQIQYSPKRAANIIALESEPCPPNGNSMEKPFEPR